MRQLCWNHFWLKTPLRLCTSFERFLKFKPQPSNWQQVRTNIFEFCRETSRQIYMLHFNFGNSAETAMQVVQVLSRSLCLWFRLILATEEYGLKNTVTQGKHSQGHPKSEIIVKIVHNISLCMGNYFSSVAGWSWCEKRTFSTLWGTARRQERVRILSWFFFFSNLRRLYWI